MFTSDHSGPSPMSILHPKETSSLKLFDVGRTTGVAANRPAGSSTPYFMAARVTDVTTAATPNVPASRGPSTAAKTISSPRSRPSSATEDTSPVRTPTRSRPSYPPVPPPRRQARRVITSTDPTDATLSAHVGGTAGQHHLTQCAETHDLVPL